MSSVSRVVDGDGVLQGAEPQVKLLSREMVLPASPSPPQPFFLSCFDIPWQDIHYNRRLLFYHNPRLPSLSSGHNGSDGQTSPLLQQLKRSLSLCLVHYFCWCGRLAKGVDPPHRLFIDCNDAGVEFVEASIDIPLSLLAQDGFQMKPFFDRLCQGPNHRGECLYSSPLLSVQATLFSDGGLALGVAHSHVVADGLSLWHFMVSWGECSRGVPLSVPPLHDRRRLAVPNPSPEKAATWSLFSELTKEDKDALEEETGRKMDSSTREEEYTRVGTDPNKERADFPLPGDGDKHSNGGVELADADNGLHNSSNHSGEGGQQTHLQPHGSLVQWMFTLSASAIKKLKSEVGEGFTTFEVICAHFWQRISVARKAPAGELTSIFVPINCRTRMMPPLPPSYFGNVIGFRSVGGIASKIRKDPIGVTARRIHCELVSLKEGSVEGFMHWVEMHDNRIVAAFMSSPWPRGKGLNVASSPWFPVYQVDFGWGKPDAVRAVKVPGDGELILFGGRPGSNPGDVEICCALPWDVLKHLLQDPVFVPKSPCPFPLD